MNSKLHRVSKGIRFAKSLAKGLNRGDFFPSDGRKVPSPAPQGTTEEKPTGGLIPRLRGEAGWFMRSHHRIGIPGIQRPIQVLHLTDVHIRTPCEWLDQLCEALADETPDLVAITGDVVTKGWTQESVEQFLSAIPEAPLGRFAVLGNWEHWTGADPETWTRLCSAHGIEVLNNRWVQREDLFIAGTDDWLSGCPDIDSALNGIPPDAPTLVLTHSPGFFPEISTHGIHLALSGHSHGGQVRIPIIGALWVPRGTEDLVAGWYEENGSHLFVSRGIGWSIAPVRLWCPPELASIQLLPTED